MHKLGNLHDFFVLFLQQGNLRRRFGQKNIFNPQHPMAWTPVRSNMVILLLFIIVAPFFVRFRRFELGPCFCCGVLGVLSSLPIILLRKKELVALIELRHVISNNVAF